MTTISARVNPRLLSKADRLFTGTLDGRIIEVLQNARRAGAQHVEILNRPGEVVIQDDGRGIADFGKLLDLGASGWEEALEAAEDPAGVGLFALAPRTVTLASRGKAVSLTGEGWRGAPVEVFDVQTPPFGTSLTLVDEPWTVEHVERHAVFSGLEVYVDARPCATAPFVSCEAADHPELGCRIEVRPSDRLTSWHGSWRMELDRFADALVNFHGQVVAFPAHPVSAHSLVYLVDLIGAPTPLRLLLPARTRLVENAALDRLREVLKREAFRYLQRCGRHALPYAEYREAIKLGLALPEAQPTFSIGVLHGEDPPPVPVIKPASVPLQACVRFHEDDLVDENDAAAANVHLLAALGKLDAPFVPVTIPASYHGYSWANLPTVRKVEVMAGRVLQERDLWDGILTCVDTLQIKVHTSDGRNFWGPVCAASPPPRLCGGDPGEYRLYVTPQAERDLAPRQIAAHLGGWSDEGDTWDTQEVQFCAQLERFWMDLHGPHERLRRGLLEMLITWAPQYAQALVRADGTVVLTSAEGEEVTLSPASGEGVFRGSPQ